MTNSIKKNFFLLIGFLSLSLNSKNIIIPKSSQVKSQLKNKDTKSIEICNQSKKIGDPRSQDKNNIVDRCWSPLENSNLFERMCCLDFRCHPPHYAYTFLPYMTTYILYKCSRPHYKVISEERHNWLTKESCLKNTGLLFRDADHLNRMPQDSSLPLFLAEYSNSVPMIWAFNSYRDFLDFFSHFKMSLANFGIAPRPENELLLIVESGDYSEDLFSFDAERIDGSEQSVDKYFSLITDFAKAKNLLEIKKKMELKIESINTASFDVVYKSFKDSFMAKVSNFSKKIGVSGALLTTVSCYFLPIFKKYTDMLEQGAVASPQPPAKKKKVVNAYDVENL